MDLTIKKTNYLQMKYTFDALPASYVDGKENG